MTFKKILILAATFMGAFLVSLYLKKSKTVQNYLHPKTSLVFTEQFFNFDTIRQNTPVSHYFVYQNTGNEALKIDQITSTCGCTVPKWPRTPLLPGKKDSILVQYDAKKQGYFNKSVYVYSNATSSPDVLYKKGQVVQ